MYQIISIIAFLITLTGITLHYIAFPAGMEHLRDPVKKLVYFFTLLLIEQKLSFTGVLRKLVYLLTLLCFVVLAITGFYPTLVLDKHISGYLLMIHATFAPILAICLAILAVMWASHCRFTYSDWPWFQCLVQRVTLAKNAEEEPLIKSRRFGEKITFWLIIVLALPLILSIILSMFTLFGTHWQEFLLTIHRWTALVFAVVAIIHTYTLLRTKID